MELVYGEWCNWYPLRPDGFEANDEWADRMEEEPMIFRSKDNPHQNYIAQVESKRTFLCCGYKYRIVMFPLYLVFLCCVTKMKPVIKETTAPMPVRIQPILLSLACQLCFFCFSCSVSVGSMVLCV